MTTTITSTKTENTGALVPLATSKVFVSGATGFIGKHLTTKLAELGCELRCLARPCSDTKNLQSLGARVVLGDVTDRDSVLEGMRGCDRVVNLANIYSFWEPSRQTYTDINVHGTRNVMESALECGVSKVVHLSAAWVYGKPSDCPFNELSTAGPVLFSEYARSKRGGEEIAWKLYREKGLPLVVLHPGEVLGPGIDKPTGQHIMNMLRRRVRVSSFEDATVAFVHVDDVVAAIVKALEKGDNIGHKYLVGKERLALRELDRLVTQISGVSVRKVHVPYILALTGVWAMTCLAHITKRGPLWGISTDGIRSMKNGLIFDGSKAERDLGITYTPVRTALEETIASFRSNGTWTFKQSTDTQCDVAIPKTAAGSHRPTT